MTPSRLVNFFFATVSLFRRTLLREILRGSLDVDEDHGAHGRFDDRARGRSLRLWMRVHRGAMGLALLAVGTAALSGFFGVRRLSR